MDKKEKKELSEEDIKRLFITPAIEKAGWNPMVQIRCEVELTPGPVIVRGNMSSRNKKKMKFADYVLQWKKGTPVAVVEAKNNKKTVSHGMQQALGYAEILQVPSAFSSNGDAFASHNKNPKEGEEIEHEFPLSKFPSPKELWLRYKQYRNIDNEYENLILEPFYEDGSGKSPRYYQVEAINRVLEAVAKGENRLLLVMATGTGKTYTTFQIIWRLWKAKKAKRILFLVDRNILADQTLVNDFKPFGSVMTKIKNRKIDPSYEIYLGLYQALTGNDEKDKIFKNVSRDFFDLIVIDECHRGSARDDSAWREILEYFSDSIQLGLTATPKETEYVSNLTYFGEPVYTYTLMQGIKDGFLAPYKVVRIDIDKDIKGWTPPPGMKDDLGQELEQREYNQKDMDRKLILNKRTKLVAKCVMDLLKATDPYSKTIIFCEDIDHAERMRKAIVNAAGKLAIENPKYVMRITGDSPEGKAELDNFIDPESRFPVIEFKDPEFDGEPVVIYEPEPDDPLVPPDPEPGPDDEPDDDEAEGVQKYQVKGVEVKILARRVEYLGLDGNLITESYRDYSRNHIVDEYESLDGFLRKWSSVKKKKAILDELEKYGIEMDKLAIEVGKDLGEFDLICHIAFDAPALTRRERVENVKKRNYFTKYGEQARAVLEALLEKYADEGIKTLESSKVLKLSPFDGIGTPSEIINKLFGGKANYEAALEELEEELFNKELSA